MPQPGFVLTKHVFKVPAQITLCHVHRTLRCRTRHVLHCRWTEDHRQAGNYSLISVVVGDTIEQFSNGARGLAYAAGGGVPHVDRAVDVPRLCACDPKGDALVRAPVKKRRARKSRRSIRLGVLLHVLLPLEPRIHARMRIAPGKQLGWRGPQHAELQMQQAVKNVDETAAGGDRGQRAFTGVESERIGFDGRGELRIDPPGKSRCPRNRRNASCETSGCSSSMSAAAVAVDHTRLPGETAVRARRGGAKGIGAQRCAVLNHPAVPGRCARAM